MGRELRRASRRGSEDGRSARLAVRHLCAQCPPGQTPLYTREPRPVP